MTSAWAPLGGLLVVAAFACLELVLMLDLGGAPGHLVRASMRHNRPMAQALVRVPPWRWLREPDALRPWLYWMARAIGGAWFVLGGAGAAMMLVLTVSSLLKVR